MTPDLHSLAKTRAACAQRVADLGDNADPALAALAMGSAPLWAQGRAVVIQGGTLIDGTGRPAVEDAVVVFEGGRIQEVGKRGEVKIPRGAQVIDAKGKTILPGLIDGHCHYWEWLGELYLAYGVTTCPDINNSPTEWIIAQKEGIQKGKIRGPRLWISGHALDGPRPFAPIPIVGDGDQRLGAACREKRSAERHNPIRSRVRQRFQEPAVGS